MQNINNGLRRAWEGNYRGGWQLWLATDSYDDIPKARNDNELPTGTEPPISDTFTSPWVGKSLEDCAKWLQQAPADSAVHRDYFTAMNEFSKKDDTVLVCRVKSKDGDKIELEYFPQPTDKIVMEMATNGGLKFDEKAQNYQRSRMKDGKPDRSKAGPYQ